MGEASGTHQIPARSPHERDVVFLRVVDKHAKSTLTHLLLRNKRHLKRPRPVARSRVGDAFVFQTELPPTDFCDFFLIPGSGSLPCRWQSYHFCLLPVFTGDSSGGHFPIRSLRETFEMKMLHRMHVGCGWLVGLLLVFGGGPTAEAIGPFGRIDVWPFAGPSGQAALTVDCGDIDNDGDTDVVVGYGEFGIAGWYENKDGVGLTWWNSSNQAAYHAIASSNWNGFTSFLSDLDADGDQDLVGASQASGQPCITWWENSLNGTAWTMHQLPHMTGLGGIHWTEPADVDGNGVKEIVFAAYSGIGVMSLSGSYTVLDCGSLNYRCAHPANLDQDSPLEIIGVAYYGGASQPSGCTVGYHQVSIYELDGSRLDLATTDFSLPVTAWAGDFDGDGDLDVAAASSYSIRVWKNDTSWSVFSQQPTGSGTNLRAGDLDGDGRAELVTGGAYKSHSYNPSTGAWSTYVIEPSGGASYSTATLDVYDIDLDGDLDVCGPYSSGICWWGNNESYHYYNPYGGYGGGY